MASSRTMTKIAGSRSESGYISQRHRSADPDPHHNVMDPEHCLRKTKSWPCTPWLKSRYWRKTLKLRGGRASYFSLLTQPTILMACPRTRAWTWTQIQIPTVLELMAQPRFWSITLHAPEPDLFISWLSLRAGFQVCCMTLSLKSDFTFLMAQSVYLSLTLTLSLTSSS